MNEVNAFMGFMIISLELFVKNLFPLFVCCIFIIKYNDHLLLFYIHMDVLYMWKNIDYTVSEVNN